MRRVSEEVLANKKMGSLVFMMVIPSILAQLVNLLYNIVDRIYIGNISDPTISSYALGGLGICSPIIILVSAFSFFVSGGGAPLASRELGKNNKQHAEKILGNGFIILCFFAIVLGILSYVFRKPLLFLIGATDNNYFYAESYLSIYLIGTLFVQLTTGLNQFISGQGKSLTAMITVLIGAILNIALDPLFIFVFDMGVKGAALATIISQFVSCLFVLMVLLNKNTSLHLKLECLKIDWKIVKDIFVVGIASFVMAATESIIGFVLNGQLQKYGGDDYVSTLTILTSCMMLITVPISGFTQGVTPIIAYNYGAKLKSRLKSCYFITLFTCFIYCSLFALIMILFPEIFARLFTKNLALIDLTKKYLKAFIGGMIIFGIQRACQTTFIALGEAKYALFIALLRKIILLVPFAFIFPLLFGVGGVFYAECVADSLAATICGTLFFFRFKKILGSMEEKKMVQQ